jgi:hypothetical protein
LEEYFAICSKASSKLEIPVFVFLSIPLVHRRVSPDINTPQSSS